MTFDGEDERAYFARRDELCTRFAEWAQRERSAADASDVELLLDWKWGYGDGRLDRFDAADVEEFLLGWCPRKLASPPELIAGIPDSVAAYVDFLAQERLLAPGCSAVAVRGPARTSRRGSAVRWPIRPTSGWRSRCWAGSTTATRTRCSNGSPSSRAPPPTRCWTCSRARSRR